MHIYRPALLFFIVVLAAILMVPSSGYAQRANEIGPVIDTTTPPNAYIVVNADTGTILTGRNIHKVLNVASVSKIITALAAVNTIPADKEILIPAEAHNVQPMRIGMSNGEKWKRNDLLYSLLLVSANDAAYALAHASSGSIPAFNRQQNRIAKELSMKDSSFGDPSGLDDDFAISGETKMSAYDLAIAGRAVLAQKELAAIVRTLNYQFVGGDGKMHTLTNHNDTFLTQYEGANGLKTGYTQKAGRTLMVSATRNGVTLIAVVLDVQQTNEWAAQLLNEGFAAVEQGNIPKNAETLPTIGSIGSKANITILRDPARKVTKQNPPTDRNEFLSVPLVSLLIISCLGIAYMWRRRIIVNRKRRRRKQLHAIEQSKRRKMMDTIDLTIDSESELISKQ